MLINGEVDFKKQGVISGVILGSFMLILLFSSYYINLQTFNKVQLYSSFIPFIFCFLLVRAFLLRKKNSGFISLQQGLQFAFLGYIISSVMVAAGTYILYNIIDKDLTEKSVQLALTETKRTMEGLHRSQSEIKEELDAIRKSETTTGLKKIVLGLGIDLIFSFIKSLLVVILVRREKKP